MSSDVSPTNLEPTPTEQVVSEVLAGAFQLLATQLVKQVASKLDLPLVNEAEQLAAQARLDEANQQLARINREVADKEASLTTAADVLLADELERQAADQQSTVLPPKTPHQIGEMQRYGERALLLLQTPHYSDIVSIEEFNGNYLSQYPECYKAICSRLNKALLELDLERSLHKLTDPVLSIGDKEAMIAKVEQLRSKLVDIDDTINQQIRQNQS